MIQKINHIAIAVNNIEEQMTYYKDILKLKLVCVEEVAEQKVKAAMFQVGDVRIELLEPTSDDSPIAKYLSKKGQGIHHIAYEVEDVKKSIEEMKANDIRMINEEPRDGAHNTKIAFAHPKSTFSVLTELCQSMEH